MKIVCVIPARYASTRLPGKPLLEIAGKPMIQRTYEQAKKASIPDEVWVATDDKRVFDTVESFGGKAIMTSPHHMNGTDRLAEVALLHPEADIIVNVQGDEPLIAPDVIDRLCNVFSRPDAPPMATVATEMEEEEYNEPSAVKVVMNLQGEAMYFSRSLLPYPRNAFESGSTPYKHIGIYAYKRDFLLQYANMEPTPLEKTESLEQLRVLENGYKIQVIVTKHKFIGIDTPEDLDRIRKYFAEEGEK